MNKEQEKEVSVKTEDSLRPNTNRVLDPVSFFLMWTGGSIAISVFAMGANLFGKLNLFQFLICLSIGTVLPAVTLVINGLPGHKYGIPFAVQIRSSFGRKGGKFATIMRGLPALVWFGFQTWVGAEAINTITVLLFGFDNVAICFVLFLALQCALSLGGFQGIKWLENFGTAFLIVALVYMLIVTIRMYGTEIVDTVIKIDGTWGLTFWGGALSFLGTSTTLILNASDYSRQYIKEGRQSTLGVVYWLGMAPPQFFMAVIGLIVSGATGSFDPIAVFSQAIDNKLLLVITLLFVIFSQITTNVVQNLVPPAYILMDFSKKISYKKAIAIVCVLSACTCPWLLINNETGAAGLALFVKIYSAFLGPIFAVMVADYFFIRKRTLDIDALYNDNSPFGGINWCAIIASVFGAGVGLLIVDLSWFLSLIPAGGSYILLMKYTKLGQSFLPGKAEAEK